MRVIRRLLARLIALVVLSPIALLVILGLGALLRGLDDRVGAVVCGRVVLIGAVIWFVGVIGMGLLTAVLVVAGPPVRRSRRCGKIRSGQPRGPGRRRRWQRREPPGHGARRRHDRGDPGGTRKDG